MRLLFAAALVLAVAAPVRAADVEAAPPPAAVRADYPIIGELRCNVAGGIGFVIAGKRGTTCIYYRADGRVEFYIGSFGRFGIDVGPAQARQAIFEVKSSGREPIGALDGDFIGLGAGSSLGRGASGDALVGGRENRVLIFPIANSRMTGLNFAVAIASLHLRYKGTEGRRERLRDNLPEGLD